MIRPLGTSKVMSSSTVCEPNDLVTHARREMIGSPGAIQAAPLPAAGCPYGRTHTPCRACAPPGKTRGCNPPSRPPTSSVRPPTRPGAVVVVVVDEVPEEDPVPDGEPEPEVPGRTLPSPREFVMPFTSPVTPLSVLFSPPAPAGAGDAARQATHRLPEPARHAADRLPEVVGHAVHRVRHSAHRVRHSAHGVVQASRGLVETTAETTTARRPAAPGKHTAEERVAAARPLGATAAGGAGAAADRASTRRYRTLRCRSSSRRPSRRPRRRPPTRRVRRASRRRRLWPGRSIPERGGAPPGPSPVSMPRRSVRSTGRAVR